MAKFDDIAAASVNINGKANLRLGFNVGAMYDINDKWTIGASYRSKVKAKVKEGDVSLTYPNEALLKKILGSINSFGSMLGMSSISLPDFNNATFSAELPLPSNFNIGVSYKPNNRWIVTGEVDFVGWGAYDKLDINFQPTAELGKYDINATKDYKNTRIYRIGTQYATTKRLDLRFGAYVDESPVKDNYLNPETPSMTKLGISAGLSFRPVNRLSVDFSFTYVTGFGREGSYTDQSIFLKKMDSVPSEEKLRTFGGHYDVTALMPAIGLSYAF
jgi:long-chain fatty acid transport protein